MDAKEFIETGYKIPNGILTIDELEIIMIDFAIYQVHLAREKIVKLLQEDYNNWSVIYQISKLNLLDNIK